MSRWKVTIETLDDLHAWLLARSGRGGKLVLDQVALAAEYGISHDRFHRLVHKLLDDGRLKEIGRGMRGMKTVIVKEAP